MANSDNKCADLNVEDFYTGVEDTLGLVYNKQKELQEKNPEVTFLFISMDKSYESWLKGIEKYE